ncbi:ABC-ATPase domain-containing protein [Bacillus sp. FJAT-44742]|uniref:ABC-ATPase domain-containing protein n=1 Tax=Bacillus sp. FJAT-44742 TaxID=2014005 RepID=UPI002FCCE9EA
MPARGRTILGKQAAVILTEELPVLINEAVFGFEESRLTEQLILTDQQEAIRTYLHKNKLVSFVANGSILPRESGISNKPLQSSRTVSFQSPPSMEIEIPVPHRSPIKGMGLTKGVNLVVGGGYHGKSTLLEAIERGVYNHRPGDGREYVITEESACKIRAEDGRSVKGVDISPFISNLPIQKNTQHFSTDNASGSTSQAANIMESIEAGAETLLIDEDTSATNFMIRDSRMQALVAKEKEPITPFIDKVTSLYQEHGISTILVVGGSGDYFEVADKVVMMDEYTPVDVTEKAKEIAMGGKQRRDLFDESFGDFKKRMVKKESFNARKGKKEKVDAKGRTTIFYGREAIDLSFVEQLVDPSQTRAVAAVIKYCADKLFDDQTSLPEILDRVEKEMEEKGIDMVSSFQGKHPGELAKPRRLEVAAAINRLRSLQVAKPR